MKLADPVRQTDGQLLTGSDVFISDVEDGKTSGPGGGPAFRHKRGLMESGRGPDIADSVGGPAYTVISPSYDGNGP